MPNVIIWYRYCCLWYEIEHDAITVIETYVFGNDHSTKRNFSVSNSRNDQTWHSATCSLQDEGMRTRHAPYQFCKFCISDGVLGCFISALHALLVSSGWVLPPFSIWTSDTDQGLSSKSDDRKEVYIKEILEGNYPTMQLKKRSIEPNLKKCSWKNTTVE